MLTPRPSLSPHEFKPSPPFASAEELQAARDVLLAAGRDPLRDARFVRRWLATPLAIQTASTTKPASETPRPATEKETARDE